MTTDQRLILARAEKRLTSHIAHHGINDAALALCARYEAEYAAAAAPAPQGLDRFFRDVVAAGIGEVA